MQAEGTQASAAAIAESLVPARQDELTIECVSRRISGAQVSPS
jgi:hypothetical protein